MRIKEMPRTSPQGHVLDLQTERDRGGSKQPIGMLPSVRRSYEIWIVNYVAYSPRQARHRDFNRAELISLVS